MKKKKLTKNEQIKSLEWQLNNVSRCIAVMEAISGTPFHTSSMHDEATKLAIRIRELKQNDNTK